jgi:hypothetical protein
LELPRKWIPAFAEMAREHYGVNLLRDLLRCSLTVEAPVSVLVWGVAVAAGWILPEIFE